MRKFKKVDCTKEYREYLKSPEWKECCKVVWKRENYKCQMCGYIDSYDEWNDLQVHHICSKHRFFEKGYENELMLLCSECHDRIHDFFDARDLVKEHKNDREKPNDFSKWIAFINTNQAFADSYFNIAKKQNGY